MQTDEEMVEKQSGSRSKRLCDSLSHFSTYLKQDSCNNMDVHIRLHEIHQSFSFLELS